MRLNHLLAALFTLAVVATPVSAFANEHHAAKTEHHEATHAGEHHAAKTEHHGSKTTEHHEATHSGEHHEGAEHHKPEASSHK